MLGKYGTIAAEMHKCLLFPCRIGRPDLNFARYEACIQCIQKAQTLVHFSNVHLLKIRRGRTKRDLPEHQHRGTGLVTQCILTCL